MIFRLILAALLLLLPAALPAAANEEPPDPDAEAAGKLCGRLDTIFQIADTCLEAGKVDDAIKEYEKLLALEPAKDAGPKATAELLRGKCRACVSLVDLAADKRGDKEAALGYARRALDLLAKTGEGDRDLLNVKIDLLRRAADLHKERKEFDKSLELLREAEALQAK